MTAHYQNYYTFYKSSYLNPFAPEFHPIFPSNNTINSTYYNYIYHHHHHRYTNNNNTNNYYSFYNQNYPFETNANNFFHMHHQINNINNNLNYHGQAQDYIMQRQPQLGQQIATSPRRVHFSSSPSSQIRPSNTRAWASPQDGSGGGASSGRRSSRWAGCSGSSSSITISNRRSDYCERKKGFNFNDLGKRKVLGDKKKESNKMFITVKPHGVETSAMIRNIPNQYTREMLIKFLDEFCRIENQRLSSNDDHQPLAFDFLYLPIDFKSGANKGYAFVNFTHPIAVWKLHLAYNNQRWEFCKSHKICKINYATIQGKENLVEHFGLSKFICDHEDYLPVCFNPPRDGSGASVTKTTVGKCFSPRN